MDKVSVVLKGKSCFLSSDGIESGCQFRIDCKHPICLCVCRCLPISPFVGVSAYGDATLLSLSGQEKTCGDC